MLSKDFYTPPLRFATQNIGERPKKHLFLRRGVERLLFILLSSEKNEPRSSGSYRAIRLVATVAVGVCGTRSARTVLALLPPSPLRLRCPIKVELISPFSGFIQLSFSIPPSLRATSPIAHTCAEEEINAFLLNCLCFLRLVSILVQHLVMIGHGRGRSENLSLCRNEKYHFQFSPLLISFVMSCGRGGGLILFSLLRDWK